MKVLSTEQQTELRNLLEQFAEHQIPIGLSNPLTYWIMELKPKRVRRKGKTGLDLNTDEGIIEQAYQEHTGNI